MKATGIVRRIDDLGRVVVPKEIRRTLRIREGDPMEIYTDKEGEIILKKYSHVGELTEFSKQYAESLAQTTGNTICVTDRDKVVAAAGPGKKELMDKNISKFLEGYLEDRLIINASRGEKKFIKIVDDFEDVAREIIVPIIYEGDVIGAVIMLTRDEKNTFSESDVKVITSAAHFLGKQM